MQCELGRMPGAPRGHVTTYSEAFLQSLEEQRRDVADIKAQRPYVIRMQKMCEELDREMEENPLAALIFRVELAEKSIRDDNSPVEQYKQQYFVCSRCRNTHKGACASSR